MSAIARALRLLRRALVALLVLLALGVLALYGWTEHILRRNFDVPLTAFTAPSGADAVALGQRQARLRGCFNGCHGDRMEGKVMVDEPWVGRLVAPDLGELATRMNDAELERAIRRGVKADGRGVAMMPSYMFYDLSDGDLGAIIAFVRTQPRGSGLTGEVALGPLGRLGVAVGELDLAIDSIQHGRPRLDHGGGSDPIAFGRYLARTLCTECHGLELKGGDDTPDLAIARAYGKDGLREFFKTGVALGGRELELMSPVARERLSHLTDDEVSALYDYLDARASGLDLAPAAGTVP